MKVLILGGDGFIGSYMRKKHLSVGDKVSILDKADLRSNINDDSYVFYHNYVENGDFKYLDEVLLEEKPDFVYNCIAVATPHYYVLNPIETFELDFRINHEIIKRLMALEIPFMHFSTSEVYGKIWSEPYSEDSSNMVLGPVNKIRWIYATSKILLDQLLFAYKADCVVVRPFNFIAHDMDWLPDIDNNTDNTWKPRMPACFLNNLLSGKPLCVVNPGTQKRCYTFIDDAVEAMYAIVQNWSKCSGEILNIGVPENEITIYDAAHIMIDFYEEITHKEHPGMEAVNGEDFYGIGYDDSERRLPNISKIRSLTGWEPKCDLETTFRNTVFDAVNKFSETGN